MVLVVQEMVVKMEADRLEFGHYFMPIGSGLAPKSLRISVE